MVLRAFWVSPGLLLGALEGFLGSSWAQWNLYGCVGDTLRNLLEALGRLRGALGEVLDTGEILGAFGEGPDR